MIVFTNKKAITRAMVRACGITALFLFSAASVWGNESRSVYKLGERFYGDSLYGLALEQYRKFLNLKRETHEFDAEAHYKIGICHYRMENMRNAAEAFERYIELFPSESAVMDAIFLAGRARKELGDYKEASDWFYTIWSRFVGSGKARLALFEAAWCAERGNNPDRAAELYDVFFTRFPDHPKSKEASLALVRLYIDGQDYPRSSGVLEKIDKQWSKDQVFQARLLYYKGILARKMQRPDEAEKHFAAMQKKTEKAFVEQERGYREYIDLLVERDKEEQALAVFERLSAALHERGEDLSSSMLQSWAECARRAGSFEAAEELYRRLLRRSDGGINAEQARYRLAECLVGRGKFPQAIETLQMLASADSAGEYGTRAIRKIGDLYYGRELYPSAIAAYRRYLGADHARNRDRIVYRIGKIYQDKYQRFGAALREYENLLKQFPGSSLGTKVFLAIAQCHEAERDYRSAIRHYEYVAESGGDKALVEEASARAAYLQSHCIRDAESAVYAMGELFERDPDSLRTEERLMRVAGVFENHLKDYPRALEVYRRVLDSATPTSDSVHALVMLRAATVYRKLNEKAAFEGDERTAAFARENARTMYRAVLDTFSSSSSVDDAAFNLMMMTAPGIEEYEAYIQRYPNSVHLPTVLASIAEHYEEAGDDGSTANDRKAVEAYGTIVEEFPSSNQTPNALLGLMRCYLSMGELDSVKWAVEKFHERFADDAGRPEAYFLSGMLAKSRGDHAGATEVFKQVLYRYPFSPFAASSRYEVALAELETGKVFDALSDFQLYEQNYPDGEHILRARYGIGKCLLRLDRLSEAAALFDELLAERLPESIVADIHYELGRATEIVGDVYGALDHYKKAVSYEQLPPRGDAYKRLGSLYFESRLYAESAAAFGEALRLAHSEADSAAALARGATALIMNGEGKKADRWLKLLDERFGSYRNYAAEVVYYEGVYNLVEKEYDKALKRFEYVLAKYEESERVDDAAYQIGLTLFYADKKDRALKIFHEFPTRYPQSEFVPPAHFKVGMLHHTNGDFAQAADYFVRVVEHERSDSTLRFRSAYNAAVAYQKISSWLDAAKMYTIVLKDYPGEVPASELHLKIGFSLVQASRFDDALRHFEKANIDPAAEDKPEILYWIGVCYAKLGEYQRAISEYLKVPYLYAGVGKWGVTAEYEAGRLYERQGEYDKAVSLYKKIVRSDGENGRFGKRAAKRIQRLVTLTEDSP
ncbi:MAG: tetratricopeptide repeat protein [Chitinivibrionales bacterium]|nr:tetratricopeptide repeat protein [Chitinivibrionales bacterium]MBD3357393.1 tetratricopeptide repeat protein [Chitinivibrionales bacterium]